MVVAAAVVAFAWLGSTVDDPTARTFRPGSRKAVVWSPAPPALLSSLTASVTSTLTVSPGVTKPPTAWVLSRLTVIAWSPFGIAPATVLTSCDDCTNSLFTSGVPA